MDDHAQLEISDMAKRIYEIIKPIVPMACEAFEDYRLNAVTLTGPEVVAIKTGDTSGLSKRELDEFRVKNLKLGLMNERGD
jgi:thymidylate synthase (FAD)